MNSPIANQLATKIRPEGGLRLPFRPWLIFLCVWSLTPIGRIHAQDEPTDPHAILKAVRVAQSAQNSALSGAIRTGPQSLPFRLVSSNGTVRYEFSDPAQVIQLRLGERRCAWKKSAETARPRSLSEAIR